MVWIHNVSLHISFRSSAHSLVNCRELFSGSLLTLCSLNQQHSQHSRPIHLYQPEHCLIKAIKSVVRETSHMQSETRSISAPNDSLRAQGCFTIVQERFHPLQRRGSHPFHRDVYSRQWKLQQISFMSSEEKIHNSVSMTFKRKEIDYVAQKRALNRFMSFNGNKTRSIVL